LYWQVGEMLNAMGHIDQAHDIFWELGEAGMVTRFKGLPRHRRVLIEAKPAFVAFNKFEAKCMLLGEMMLLPRPHFGLPVASDISYVTASLAAVAVAPHASKMDVPSLPAGFQPGPAATTPPAQMFNYKHVTVGFAFGFLVAALLGLQLREWQRRRQVAIPADSRGEPPPHPPPG
jgi:hypothetical protein